jgi:hypothetical protein
VLSPFTPFVAAAAAAAATPIFSNFFFEAFEEQEKLRRGRKHSALVRSSQLWSFGWLLAHEYNGTTQLPTLSRPETTVVFTS